MSVKPSAYWLDQTTDGRKFAFALVAGLALELAALALLLPFVTRPTPPPAQTRTRVQLTIVAPPAPKPPPAPAPKPQPVQTPPPTPKPPPPLPRTPPLPVPPPPAPVPTPRAQIAPRKIMHHVVPVIAPRPPAATPPPVTAIQTPPLAPAAPSAGQVDLFRDAVRRAVQQVANSVYPRGAQQGGAVGITITYLNGRVLSVTLARSSGVPVLDAAALEAGRVAVYPWG